MLLSALVAGGCAGPASRDAPADVPAEASLDVGAGRDADTRPDVTVAEVIDAPALDAPTPDVPADATTTDGGLRPNDAALDLPATDATTPDVPNDRAPATEHPPSCSAGTSWCAHSCRDLTWDPAHCGACDHACTGGRRCSGGSCACAPGQGVCADRCVDHRVDRAHCGACDRACAEGEVCRDGACTTTCAGVLANCGGVCVDTAADPAHCGACGHACAGLPLCVAGRCADVSTTPFRVTSLSTTGCTTREIPGLTEPPAAGVALAPGHLYVSGPGGTARLDPDTLAGERVAPRYEALLSNLRDGTVYVLVAGDTPLDARGGTATALVELHPSLGTPTARRVALSSGIALPPASNLSSQPAVALFSGWDRAVLTTPSRAWHVELPSGRVTDLGATSTPPLRMHCRAWAISGVAEYFDGALHLLYVLSSNILGRARIPAGASPNAAFSGAGAVCGFTVSPARGRWYFHREGGSPTLPDGRGVVGWCPADIDAPMP
jgi:hypothetical protein